MFELKKEVWNKGGEVKKKSIQVASFAAIWDPTKVLILQWKIINNNFEWPLGWCLHVLLFVHMRSLHHASHGLSERVRFDVDPINYATKYTIKIKAKFPTVTKSILMNLYLQYIVNQEHQDSSILLTNKW